MGTERDVLPSDDDLAPKYLAKSLVLEDPVRKNRRSIDYPNILTDIERSSRLRPAKKHEKESCLSLVGEDCLCLITQHTTKHIFECHVYGKKARQKGLSKRQIGTDVSGGEALTARPRKRAKKNR